MYLNNSSLVACVFFSSVFLAPISVAQDKQCAADRIDGREFEAEYMIGQERTADPVKAEKRLVIAADRFVVPTNGYVLQKDASVDGVVLPKGTVLDFWDEVGSKQICGYSAQPKSKLKCFLDADGDGQYESFIQKDSLVELADPLKLELASEVFSHSMSTEDIAFGLPALIRSVEVKKVKKKKYVELVLGTGNGFREVGEPMSLGSGTYEKKIKIKSKDVSSGPIILGGIQVFVSIDEAGDFWVKGVGEFTSPTLSRDCTNTQLEFGSTKLQTHQNGFRGKSGITAKYLNIRQQDITYEAEF